ncbi:complement C1q-like protein 3 [Mytilus trossulus]|uniref:complement C1q-like protein 3 n=1 Tax=Mytilus trossulus TaxID=6551 RepID=UPI003005227E
MAWYRIILCLSFHGIIAIRNDINLENLLDRMETYEKKIAKLEMEVERMSVIEKEAAELRQIVKGNSRHRRFLLNEGPGVAFSAYKSASFDATSFGLRQTFIYDHVECNVGNGYENFTGIFRPSLPGTYAFTWTVCASGSVNSEIGVELVIDNKVHGSIYVDSETHAEEHCSTGFVIHTLKTGDVVYTRSQGAGHEGTIRSDKYTRTTFSGWLLFY